MQTRWLFLSLLIFHVASAPRAVQAKQHPHETPQTQFSAEEAGVKQPVAIPGDVMAILRQDENVRNILESKNILPENLPSSWFSASAIHLSSTSRTDLVVVGESPLAGANVVTFWVFCATAHGYRLVLTAPAHDLEVTSTRWKGYRDIELISLTAVQISRVICRFDGKRYRAYKSTSEPIQ